MYESVAILKGNAETTRDSYGNEVITYSERTVFVKSRSVYQSEFYNAAQSGLHPSLTFELSNRLEYDGERIIEHNGIEYNVIRVDWDADSDKVRLICEERINAV